jgi:hypothetical protein
MYDCASDHQNLGTKNNLETKKPFQDNFHLFENRELFTMFLYSGRKVNDGTCSVPMTLVKKDKYVG